jgi:hypothetical protein
LSDNTLISIHWPREPHFQKWLKENNFIKCTIARNPFDILISVLHFSRNEPQVHRWLEGNAEIPASFKYTSPASDEFLNYCLSTGSENLLSVSYQWWNDPTVIRLRYEDLVKNPDLTFEAVVKNFNGATDTIAEHLKSASLDNMKRHKNNHGWKATPGLYKKLLPPLNAWKIYQKHKCFFNTLGYHFSPYLLLNSAAERNWEKMKVI